MEPNSYSLKNMSGNADQPLRTKLAETTLLLEVLAGVNLLLSKTQNFESFCVEITKLLKDKLKFYTIHIWIRDERVKDQLYLVTPAEDERSRSMPLNTGIVGKTIREGRTVCLPDARSDPNYFNADPITKSELCIPLIYDNEVIGAINIETDTYQNFAAELPILEVIATNLSYCIKLALLYRTKEQFQYLVENMSEGVWVGDMNEHTTYTNPALQKILGYTEKEFLEKTSYEYFDKSSLGILHQENEKRKHGIGGHYEAILVSKSGERIPVLMHGVPFGNGGGTIATITDLRTLRKLARTEKILSSITQHCPEAIVGLDVNENILSWNVGAERIFGYKTDELMGKSVYAIIPEDRISSGEVKHIIDETNIKGLVRNFETLRMHKNGTLINVSITCSGIKDEQGKLIGYSVVYRDITAQKKWEYELQDRFEKMQDAYKEMGKQRRYLDYIVDIVNMATSSNYTSKQIATFLVNAMVMITKVNSSTLRLLDKNTGKLILVAQSGLGEEWWGKKSISYSGSLLEIACKQKRPLKILDILSNPHYTSPALAQRNSLRSALVIPLEIKGEVLGSLTLYLSHEGNLSLLDDEFIDVFAKQAALALKLAS
jgi:PAS domain S-box-containing protein